MVSLTCTALLEIQKMGEQGNSRASQNKHGTDNGAGRTAEAGMSYMGTAFISISILLLFVSLIKNDESAVWAIIAFGWAGMGVVIWEMFQ